MLLTKHAPTELGKHLALWRILSLFFIGIILMSFMYSGWFLYTKIFHTLEDASAVALLNPGSNSDVLDVAQYNQAKRLVATKNTPTVFPATLRSIFSYSSSTPNVSSTPSHP